MPTSPATGFNGAQPDAKDSTKKDKAQPTAAAGGKNEQTQSLYAQGEGALACGAFYLSVPIPVQLRTAMGAGREPLQMNILPAPVDNPTGEQISRSLCRAYQILNNKKEGGNLSESLERLNEEFNVYRTIVENASRRSFRSAMFAG